MSVSKPSQGTHFSDGVRTGPIIGSSFIPGANVLTPSVMVSSPIDQLAPGVFNTPMSLLDIIPTPISSTNIAAAQTPAGAGYINLVNVSGVGITVMTYQSIPNVLKLDCARNVQILGTTGCVTASTFLVFGWDEYGIPMTEQITGPVGNITVVGNKAFRYIQAIHSSAGTGANISIGTGDVFGLPYLITSGNYGFSPSFQGIPDTTFYQNITAGSFSTTNASAVVAVTTTSTSSLITGQMVSISGAVAVGGISADNLNVVSPITVVDGTHFSYTAYAAATSTTTGGGNYGAWTTLIPGDQEPATATSGDIRGTYSSSRAGQTQLSAASRLTINFYNASGDGRNYNASNNGTLNLNLNPLYCINGFASINVFAPNHQLTTGENVTISGATTFGGIAAGSINIGPVPVTVIDQNFFTYNGTANATSTAQGGGSVVNMTPRFGNLYQTTTGRFGVAQYNLTPLP